MHNISPMIVTKEHTSFTELLDNVEGIILDLDNLHYYTLNSTGILLWKELRKGTAERCEDLVEMLGQACQIPVHVLEGDVRAFLRELEANGLISYTAGLTGSEVGELAKRAGVKAGLAAYQAPQLKISNALTQVTLSGSSTIATGAITATGG